MSLIWKVGDRAVLWSPSIKPSSDIIVDTLHCYGKIFIITGTSFLSDGLTRYPAKSEDGWQDQRNLIICPLAVCLYPIISETDEADEREAVTVGANV